MSNRQKDIGADQGSRVNPSGQVACSHKDNSGIGGSNRYVQGAAGLGGVMMMVKVIETIFLGPGDICCNALGVSQENNRDLVRMLINSFVWAAVGGMYIAAVV